MIILHKTALKLNVKLIRKFKFWDLAFWLSLSPKPYFKELEKNNVDEICQHTTENSWPNQFKEFHWMKNKNSKYAKFESLLDPFLK
jgi:hypothetical protein